MDKTHNLRYLLTELIRTHNFEPKMLEQKVFALWREYLGAPLGTKTVPVSVSNGILKVYTEYPPYRTHLSLLKPNILADLNAELGAPVLKDLRIEVRHLRATHPHAPEDRPANAKTSKADSLTGNPDRVTAEQLEKIEQTLTSVSDMQLKKTLWQLFLTQSNNTP